MTKPDPLPDDFESDGCYRSRDCYRCAGAGYIVTCPDDICRGRDECMHGDGEVSCPVCNADGLEDWIR